MSITILLVEDDPSLRELLKVLLEGEGYDMGEPGDGREGVEKAGEPQPDLMIVDLMRPQVGGERVTSRLRADPGTRRMPVIVVSGRYEALDRCRDMIGPDNGFAKPFEPVKLLKRVGTLVGQAVED